MRRGLLLGLGLWVASFAMGQDIMSGAQQGLPAPAFSASAVNGGSVTLASLIQKQGALVAFADPRSDDGKRVLAFLQQSRQRLSEMQVGVVAFAINVAQLSTVSKLVKDNALSLPVVHDSGQKVASAYGVQSSACIVVVDPTGTVYQRYDATENQPNIGPLAIGGARDMLEALKAAEGDEAAASEQPAGDAAAGSADGAAGPGTASTAGSGAAPLAAPDDDATRQQIQLGWSLVQQGQLASALAQARKLAQARGPEPLSALWLAYVLEANGEYPEAAVTYRKVLALQPANQYATTAIQRIDPDGQWLTSADLPRYLPAGPPPPAPVPGEQVSGASATASPAPVNTTSEGQATIGD